MKRVIILMLDSVGIGSSEDADKFGDEGANTLGHIAQACAKGECENRGGDYGEPKKNGVLNLSNLEKLGLGLAAEKACGSYPLANKNNTELTGAYAYAQEVSSGKDTPSGHWEMAGSPVLFDWGYFRNKTESFPKSLIDKVLKRAGLESCLGNCHASGTNIIAALGEQHMQTNHPIFYTSADSVVQIACHEETFGLENLYKLCEVFREVLDDIEGLTIGRVIARPFVGDSSKNFKRTGNRKDYAIEPPYETVLKKQKDHNGEVISVGKISDIYAHIGITKQIKASGLTELWDKMIEAVDDTKNHHKNTIIFTNFVDFDSEYGHRRNISGYAAALEYFDEKLPSLFPKLTPDDLLLVTADHGNDPSWQGTEHTREFVPILWYGNGITAGEFLGKRESFADMGQTIASYLDLPKLNFGKNML